MSPSLTTPAWKSTPESSKRLEDSGVVHRNTIVNAVVSRSVRASV
jgi:hypothetical protein